MNPYEELANAIIEQAVKDFKKVLKCHFIHPNRKNYSNEVLKLKQFFRSNWFSILTDLDGEYIINGVYDMVKKEMVA